MNIISKRYLDVKIKQHPELKVPLMAWYKKITQGEYKTPQEIIMDFKNSDYVGDNRIVFNIAHNKFRLIVGSHLNLGQTSHENELTH
jgi:mRNA interferase HigB